MADDRLVTAISRIATQYIPNTKGEVRLGWIARINDYSGRLLRAAHPVDDPDDGPEDVGSDLIPNNAQPLPEGVSYEDFNVDPAEYEAQHGESPQESANQALTRILRPNQDRYANETDPGALANYREEDATRQAAALAWIKGEIPFSHVLPYLGLSRKVLGAITIAELKDLGPDFEED